MRFFIFLILLTFFVSEIEESAICLEEIETKETLGFLTSHFFLEFKHSIYGGDVVLTCKVVGGKIVVKTLESDDEASISYYTDLYKPVEGKFVAEIEEKMDAVVVNEGWKVKIQGNEFETKSVSRIFPCRW
ncbi:MAG: hypothetical protein QXD49_04670 [Archaeoglobaceae archaeon]